MRAREKGGAAPFFYAPPDSGWRGFSALLLALAVSSGWAGELPPAADNTVDHSTESRASSDSSLAEDDEDEDSVPISSQGAGADPAGPAAALRRYVAPGLRVAPPPSVSWAIPPVPWRAQLTLTNGWNRSSEGRTSGVFSKSLSTQANSYIWQPWFARVNGSATFIESDTRDVSGKSSGKGVSGDVRLNMLSSSRFPLSLAYGQSHSRAESRASSSSAVSRRFSMDQRYTPLEGTYSLGWGYSQSQIESSAAGRNVVQSLNTSLTVPMPGDNPQSVSAGSTWSRNRANATGSSSDFGSVNASHSIYLEDYVLTINSDVFANTSRLHSSGAFSESQVAQMGSNFDWVPDDDSPLRIAGSLRGFNTKAMAASGGAENSNRFSTLNGQLSASYPLDQWSFGGTVNGLGTWIRNAANDTSRVAQVAANASAGWRGEGWRTKLNVWDYSLSYGSSSFLSSSHRRDTSGAATTQNTLGVSGSIGQSLGRRFAVDGYRNPVRVTVGQSYSASRSSSAELVHTLSHNANANWEFDASKNTQLGVSAGASDSRSYGLTRTNYQSVDASLRGDTILGGYSSFSSDLGIQLNRQATQGAASGGGDWHGSARGGLGYKHARFADVAGLHYVARYDVNVRPAARRDLGQTAEKEFQVDHQLSQAWAWRLGLLGWQLDNSFSYDASGRTTASLFLSVTRDFGGVL